MSARIAILTAASLLFTGIAGAAMTDEQRCQSAKNKHSGKYAACLQKAEGYRVKKPKETTKYAEKVAKCNRKFAKKWAKAEDKAEDATAKHTTSHKQGCS